MRAQEHEHTTTVPQGGRHSQRHGKLATQTQTQRPLAQSTGARKLIIPLPPSSPQTGKSKTPAPPPRPPPIEEEAVEEGDDPEFISDTNFIINIAQEGPEKHDIRDTDLGGAITYCLMQLEGVDTEPDILDHSKKGPWAIFVNEDCQFKEKFGDRIQFVFNLMMVNFTISYESLASGVSNTGRDGLPELFRRTIAEQGWGPRKKRVLLYLGPPE